MPEGTDHEDIQLRNSSALEGRSYIHKLSEPLLNCRIPMGNLTPDVLICFYHKGTTCVYKPEVLPIVTDPTRMDRGDT